MITNPSEILNKHNFKIVSPEEISERFTALGIEDFVTAAKYIKQLPYRRNSNKNDLSTVFSEGCGTCGSKHAVLRQLAIENHAQGIMLMTGIFKMSAENTPAVAATLKKYNLDYIPEAHNYHKADELELDFTWPVAGIRDFKKYLLAESEFEPWQIGEFKVAYHREFLGEWIKTQQLPYSPDEIWTIRETCIQDLSKQ